MKLWKYYQRIKTGHKPACIVRCVGAYSNAYVMQFEDKTVEFVSKKIMSLSVDFTLQSNQLKMSKENKWKPN